MAQDTHVSFVGFSPSIPNGDVAVHIFERFLAIMNITCQLNSLTRFLDGTHGEGASVGIQEKQIEVREDEEKRLMSHGRTLVLNSARFELAMFRALDCQHMAGSRG